MSILQILGALEEQGGQSQGTNEPGGCSHHDIEKTPSQIIYAVWLSITWKNIFGENTKKSR